MTRYAIRRNPGTGRWIMYFLDGAIYRIMGDADSLRSAIEGVFS